MDFSNQQLSTKLDLGWIFSDAFNLVKNRLGEYILMGLITMVASYVISFVVQLPLNIAFGIANPRTAGEAMGLLGASIFVSMMGNFVATAITYVLYAGIIIFSLKLLRGEVARFDDFFAGFKNFGAYFVAGVLYAVGTSIGMLACFIGSIFVAGLLMFTIPLIYDQKVSAMDAVKGSIDTLKSQWGMAGAYALVCGLVAILGVLICCVGILATFPLAFAAQAVAYHRIVGGPSGGTYLSPSQYPRDPSSAENMPEAPSAWPSDSPQPPTDDSQEPPKA